MSYHKAKVLKVDEIDGNGRIYPLEEVEKAITAYLSRDVRYGTLDGDGPGVDLAKVSHNVHYAYIDYEDNYLTIVYTILDKASDCGRILKEIHNNCSFGFSSTGKVSENGVVSDLHFIEFPARLAPINDPAKNINDLVTKIINGGGEGCRFLNDDEGIYVVIPVHDGQNPWDWGFMNSYFDVKTRDIKKLVKEKYGVVECLILPVNYDDMFLVSNDGDDSTGEDK